MSLEGQSFLSSPRDLEGQAYDSEDASEDEWKTEQDSHNEEMDDDCLTCDFSSYDNMSFQYELNVFGLLFYSMNKICKHCMRKRRFFTTVWAFLLAVMSIGMQIYISCAMLPRVSADEYAGKFNMSGNGENLFDNWRWDPTGGAQVFWNHTEAYWGCTGQSWTWHESQIDDLKKYQEFYSGKIFGTIAMLLWAATIVQEFRVVVCSLTPVFWPITEHRTNEGEGVRYDDRKEERTHIVHFMARFLMIIFFCASAFVVCALADNGTKFLARTNNLKDFILNSVALGFIFQIDDLFYLALGSNIDIEQFNNDRDTVKMTASIRTMIRRNGIWFIICVALFIYVSKYGIDELFRFADGLIYEGYLQACREKLGGSAVFE